MSRKPTRRSFLKLSAAAASLTAAELAHAAAGRHVRVAIVPSSPTHNSPLVNSSPVQVGSADKLRDAFTAKGVAISDQRSTLTVHVAPVNAPFAQFFPGLPKLTEPESTALVLGKSHTNTPILLVSGVDVRGLVYGLLELADRVRSSDLPMLGLHLPASLIETTPNKVRSVSRGFCSEIEDKSWFYDRAFWTTYLDTLAAARFNRFAFTLGLAYDFPRGVTGDYLHFPYPYLVEVTGYEQVHVEPALAPGERQRNLETLQFIAAETARRGMDFQLGLWTHAYQWTDSPRSDHHIVGLTPETHATYSRDALAMLLKACPQITGLTMRIHGESGIPEGSYGFWQTLWESVPAARTPEGKPRIIELDLHAKGLDPETIAIARATGMPVKGGAKFWAEHCGLGYHQADIRAAEYPRTGITGTFAVSNGARNFTRYGYGDFYQKDLGVDLLYRVWPGTQRHLLWGDPALASGYGRAANFCGASGLEIMEPLFFKGREGSGQPGGRDAYADAALGSATLDTAKFTTTFMLWGRYLYNPDTDPSFYHRYLKQAFGPAGPALETALAASSRILPLVTAAWCPSASNHEFWPEMLTHLSILPIVGKPLYGDNPAPHNVSAISPLDPQIFTTIDQHAKDLVAGTVNARYNSSEVIQWLETLVSTSIKGIDAARTAAGPKHLTPEFRRAEGDIIILGLLGFYYKELFRAALFYSIHLQTHDPRAAEEARSAFAKTRDDWAMLATRASSVYASDVSYGSTAWRRGNWADRLSAVEADVALLEKHFTVIGDQKFIPNDTVKRATNPTPRPTIAAKHTTPESFHPGSDLALTISTPPTVTQAILFYRHVNHGERWLSVPMKQSGATHAAVIPDSYTNSPYPLQYYFELRTATSATLHPPLNSTLSNQPYYAVHIRT